MGIELTEEQRRAVINGEAVRLAAPDVGGSVVVLSEHVYQRLQAILEEGEDRKLQEAFLRASHRSAVAG